MKRMLVLVCVLLVACSAERDSSAPTAAPTIPAPFAIELEEVASGFDRPLFLTHAGDERAFVVEKGGTIRTLADQALFLDISDRVNAQSSERGLLGLAFDPAYARNGYLYVNYTDADGATIVSRFSASGQTADSASEKIILRQEQPAANHNGGMLAFGPDNMLYVGLGDGGGANDTYGNGQNTATWLGALLRINVDVDTDESYVVPASNPFVDQAGYAPEIWAYGLRNPWRFSFDRQTGDLYIGDVGQGRVEWVQHQVAGTGGQNYGWPIVEGSRCLRGSNCDRTGLVAPISEYSHEFGCSIIGGYVYRGAQFAALQGVYLFGDYCSGRVWALVPNGDDWQQTQLLDTDVSISSFGEDAAGELYITDLRGGRVLRVVVP